MEETSSSNDHLYVDEFYFSALYDDEEIFPISDEKYAQELQLQEALMSSAISSIMKRRSLDREDNATPKTKPKAGKKIKDGESSQTFCVICMDGKSPEEMFRNSNCTHSFCRDCMGKYIAAKLKENITIVNCPDLNCKGVLEPEFCRSIVPQQVFDRWENALCESLVLGSHRFYCPFNDCSAMLVDDEGEVVMVSECPDCWRLFCAQCKVAWHEGIECREFQELKKDEREREDIMVMELAKNKQWRRCPSCKFYVEKISGCLHIGCRCGFQFCYGCGTRWTLDHACPSISGL